MATHNDLTNSQAELAAELETAAVEHTENLPVGSAARFAGLNVMVVGHDSDYHYPLTRIMYIATGREETVASDAVTRGDEDTCPGSAGIWGSGTGTPICPVCHVGPRGFGVSKPRRRNGLWTGRVPAHQRRTAVIKEARA